MRLAIDQIEEGTLSLLNDRCFGMLLNEASVARSMRYTCDILADRFPGQLRCLLTPQHGMFGEQQANMIETGHAIHPRLHVPVHSLYSETREPTRQMLDGIDTLVIDLQDVGCRVYTFIWTVTLCLEACAAEGIEVVLLDRINPIGPAVHGPVIERDYFSFVGLAPIPLQHGLTIGELSQFTNSQLDTPAKLTVVPVQNWSRTQRWDQLDRPWVPTSPNLPTFDSLLVYPGMVLFEGTNVSEGRGTTTPFQVIGAPWMDGERLCAQLSGNHGATLRPTRFVPTFDKFASESCGGVFIHPTHEVNSVALAIELMSACKQLWPDEFAWHPGPYEYEYKLPPIDILYGSDKLRTAIDAGASTIDLSSADTATWEAETQPFRIYTWFV